MATTPIQGLGFVSAHVRDIQKARTFYTQTLGLRELNFDANIKSAAYEIPGTTVPLSIHQFDAGCQQMGGRPPGTVTGVGILVPNVDKAVTDLKTKGVTITDAPFNLPNGARLAVIADPDGNEWVITQK